MFFLPFYFFCNAVRPLFLSRRHIRGKHQESKTEYKFSRYDGLKARDLQWEALEKLKQTATSVAPLFGCSGGCLTCVLSFSHNNGYCPTDTNLLPQLCLWQWIPQGSKNSTVRLGLCVNFSSAIVKSWEEKEAECANKELCLHQESTESPHRGCLAQIHTLLAHNWDRRGGILISQSQIINPRIILRSDLGWCLSSVLEEEQTVCNTNIMNRGLAAHTNSYQ